MLENLGSSAKRRGAAEVATDLRRAIKEEAFAQAERLPSERVLSEQFGVSRGTVRDALMRLEADGLVEIRAGSGTYVTYAQDDNGAEIISNARPLELIDTRFALEPHICRLVVLHGQERDFQSLESLLDEMEKSADDAAKFSELDTQFHAKLAASTGNSLLIWIISQINDVRGQDQWAHMRKVTLDRQIIETYNTQHRLIVEAMRRRDPERAAMLMKDHLETARRSLMRSAEA